MVLQFSIFSIDIYPLRGNGFGLTIFSIDINPIRGNGFEIILFFININPLWGNGFEIILILYWYFSHTAKWFYNYSFFLLILIPYGEIVLQLFFFYIDFNPLWGIFHTLQRSSIDINPLRGNGFTTILFFYWFLSPMGKWFWNFPFFLLIFIPYG